MTVARKPCHGGTAANVAEHGAAALNIGSCRIPYLCEDDKTPAVENGEFRRGRGAGTTLPQHKDGWGRWTVNHGGRWPANVILVGDAPARAMDAQGAEGGSRSAGGPVGLRRSKERRAGFGNFGTEHVWRYGDDGGVSRFFKRLR